jgi:hypothetical protein
MDVRQTGRQVVSPRLRLVVGPKDPVPPAIEAASDVAAQRLLAAVAAIQTWEGEGGYAPKSDESSGERYG